MAPAAGDSTAMANGRLPRMSYFSKITVTVVLTLGVLAAAWSVRQILMAEPEPS